MKTLRKSRAGTEMNVMPIRSDKIGFTRNVCGKRTIIALRYVWNLRFKIHIWYRSTCQLKASGAGQLIKVNCPKTRYYEHTPAKKLNIWCLKPKLELSKSYDCDAVQSNNQHFENYSRTWPCSYRALHFQTKLPEDGPFLWKLHFKLHSKEWNW